MKSFLFLFLFTLLSLIGFAEPMKIYVAINGSDKNAGTKEAPLATVQMALRKVRELRRLNDASVKEGANIIIAKGIYEFEEPLFIRPEDAGTLISPTTIEGAPGEWPVFSGGIAVKGWTKASGVITGLPKIATGKIWVADAPVNCRQLWVNEVKATRARYPNAGSMNRIYNWNHQTGDAKIPSIALPGLTNVAGVEMFIHQWWAIAILRVKEISLQGDTAQLSFREPENRIQAEHPWPAPWISEETGNSAFYLTNAIQFLDEPGEWFLDKKQEKIYYWPKDHENMLTASVIVPSLEKLIKVEGNADAPVSHVYFKGISFQYTSWMRPSLQGHVPHQAGMYMLDAYALKQPGTPLKSTLENQAWVGRPAAAVEINFGDNIQFDNCRFEHTASTAIDFNRGVNDNTINGSLFKDIGGTAILAGVYSDEATEIHLPYHPKNEREVCTGMVISNNLISNATNEDWGCLGIGLGYTRNSLVSHNEIEDVNYTGISMGWGWSPLPNAMKDNKIIGNKIHHYGKQNYDCAGIYTLSAQPGSVISENLVDSIYKAPFAHLPTHWFYLYTDEGSSGITVKNNWTPSAKYLQNANGPGNEWINNGPQVNEKIKAEAGLQKQYRGLLAEKASGFDRLAVNKERKEVIEMVVKPGETMDVPKLKSFMLQNYLDTNGIYQWQNHYVLFTKVQDIGVMQGRLQNNFPGVTVKVYHDMFYEFNREQCGEGANAGEWHHVLLTTNLVADEKMQQEYLNDHATQFENWPEVSNGFCRANFQELLIFKNGRQLMLVISYPKGEDFEKLNAKTTENNPRVNEWNKRMAKYQQGIEGTKKGETWVFLRKM